MTIPLLMAKVLSAASFAHGFSSRSLGNFALGPERTPPPALEPLARMLGASTIHMANQVHGSRVIVATGNTLAEDADALVADGGRAVAIRVADCVPILVADRRSGRVAAIHAGWRGVVSGVIGNALRVLESSRDDVLAAIGPCIGPCCFEVGADVAEKIGFVDRVVGDKAFVDLRRAVRAQLHGVIEDVGGCTYCDERFHSYRRDGGDSGRLVGAIVSRAVPSDREGARA